MNARKAKAARKAVRNAGRDPREVNIVSVAPFHVGAFLGRPGALFLGQRHLQANCGRAFYKSLKRAVRAGAGA